MPEIIIMGLSGDSKVLPMTATKTEIVDAILKTATKQYKIMVSETNYTAYYVEAQSPDEAQQIWADNGYESEQEAVIEDSEFTILGIEEVEGE
jgi:hypothetical protein